VLAEVDRVGRRGRRSGRRRGA